MGMPVVTGAVKEGLSELSAVHMAPVDARALIRESIQEAVAKFGDIEPLVAEPPIVLEIQRLTPQPETPPGAERVDDFTMRWTGPDFRHVVTQVFPPGRG